MSGTTQINGFTYPDLNDTANILTAVSAPIQQIDDYVVSRHASVTARDAAIITPTLGQVCYVTGSQEFYVWRGTWVGAAPRTLYTTADQQVTDNSASLVDSLYLQFAVEANSAYKVWGSLRWINSHSNNDTRIGADGPTGISGDWIIAHPAPASTYADNPAVPWTSSHGYAGSATSTQRGAFAGFLKTGVTAGTVKVQFCEFNPVAGVSWVKLLFGSELSFLKIA